MKLENQVTSLELSQQLKKLGFKQESLFYWNLWQGQMDDCMYQIYYGKPVKRADGVLPETTYSAYTVAELVEMLPTQLYKDRLDYGIYLSRDAVMMNRPWFLTYASKPKGEHKGFSQLHTEKEHSLPDTIAKMLIYLKENNLI